MKTYEKPTLRVTEIELEDIIALSNKGGTTSGKVVDLSDLFNER